MKVFKKIALAAGGIGLTVLAAYGAYRYWHLNFYPRDHRVSLSEFEGESDCLIYEPIFTEA